GYRILAVRGFVKLAERSPSPDCRESKPLPMNRRLLPCEILPSDIPVALFVSAGFVVGRAGQFAAAEPESRPGRWAGSPGRRCAISCQLLADCGHVSLPA